MSPWLIYELCVYFLTHKCQNHQNSLRDDIVLLLNESHDEILKSYPELEKKDMQQFLEYAAWLASEHHPPLAVNENQFRIRE